ncbi:MAG: hypothetical protein ACYSSP_04595 [Planctomycetota bacterium]|jgi:hypothetical protein
MQRRGFAKKELLIFSVMIAVVTVFSIHKCQASSQALQYFTIEVVDDETGRGVPMVELKTVNDIRYYTDSGGVVAFLEPGLMNRDVFFHISSHGYEFEADGFGYRGKTLRTMPGGKVRLSIKRKNIAERLYRVTGQGIYRDTVLVGGKAPIKEPLLNGRVLGLDTVMATLYRNKIYWFWGDTNRESYPLGHFATAGATSELPGKGGLDPSVGINLEYFVDNEGFSKKMVPLEGEGMFWIDGLLTVRDDSGRERLLAHYSRMANLGDRVEHGLIVFNDEMERFVKLMEFERGVRLYPGGQVLSVTVDGKSYYYFSDLSQATYPFVRVRAEWKSLLEPTTYEAFTCLTAGSGYDKDSPSLDRDADGQLIWSWKKNTSYINPERQRELISSGKIKPEEGWVKLRDIENGEVIHAKSCDVEWNDFRQRYVMILQELEGTSNLGEIWYSEADTPEGPWKAARKIVTHDRYTFYNPAHHIFFDQEGGRIIYFEATYTNSFSATDVPTPWYNYNQIMYRLDLANPQLELTE